MYFCIAIMVDGVKKDDGVHDVQMTREEIQPAIYSPDLATQLGSAAYKRKLCYIVTICMSSIY